MSMDLANTTIDLSDFSEFSTENYGSDVAEYTNNGDGTLTIEAKTATNAFLIYYVPGPLPVGSKVSIECDSKSVSGDIMRYSIDTYDTPAYDGASKTFNYRADASDDSGQWQTKTTGSYIENSKPYARVIIGFFRGVAGIGTIRTPKILIEGADLDLIKPELTTPANYSRHFSIDELNREWVSSISGTGTVTRGANDINITAAIGGKAYVRWGSDNTTILSRDKTSLRNIAGSKGFIVSIKGTRTSGTPCVLCDYVNFSNTVVRQFTGLFLSADGETAQFWFPPISTVERVHIAVGFFDSTGILNDGDFTLESVKITQYGAPESWSPQAALPISCVLTKAAGSWKLFNDAVADGDRRFISSRAETVTVNGNILEVNFALDSVRGERPVVLSKVSSTGGHVAAYYTGDGLTRLERHDINIYDRVTNAIVDPATVPDGMAILVHGMGQL